MKNMYIKVGNTFLIKILGLVLAFAFQIMISRYLEPMLYGQFTLFLTYSSILSVIAVMGMDQNLIKEVAREAKDRRYIFKLFGYSIRISLILFLIISAFAIIFYKNLMIPLNMMHLLIIILFLKIVVSIVDGFLQGVGLIIPVTLSNVLINNTIKIALFVLFVYLEIGRAHV